MDNIPDELLLNIFYITVSDHSNHPTEILALTHVCSRWRATALSSGKLWTRIVLTHPIYPGYLSYVNACLERSRSYPLDIFFDFRDPAWDWDEDTHSFKWQEMESIMRLFLAHVTRWRRIELLADTWSPIFTFLWHTREVKSAPVLSSISLSRCNLYYAARGNVFQPESLRQPLPFFGGISLPSLTSVSLIGTHISWNQPYLCNLTELELKYHAHDVMPTLSQFEAICLASPRLLRLAIFGWGPLLDNSRTVRNGQLHLNHLQRFSFGFLDIPYSLQFLSLFDFPSLSELVLEDVSRVVSPSDEQDATSLIEWFCSTPSLHQPRNNLPLHQLRKFEIHSVQCSAAAFGKFLSRLAALTSIGLFDVANDLLCLLISRNDLESLCPQVEDLYCQDTDPDSVFNVVSSRAFATGLLSPLRKVTLEFVRQSSPSPDSFVYRQLVSMGVEIQGRYGSDSSDSQHSG